MFGEGLGFRVLAGSRAYMATPTPDELLFGAYTLLKLLLPKDNPTSGTYNPNYNLLTKSHDPVSNPE